MVILAVRTGPMQDLASGLPRILLPRTRVNRLRTQALNLGLWHHDAQGRGVEQGG
jgi:hypothetical protein